MTAPKSSSRTLEIPRRAATFAAAAFALMACFFGSAIAIPMMAVWKPALAMTTGDVAMTVVSYFGGCILTLLFFARLSNFFGRKPVVVAGLILGAAACWIFASAESTAALDAGRFLQGLSCGFASSAAMSWVVDSAPPNRAWVGTALTAAGPNIGLSIGTFLSGIILDRGLLSPEALFDATIVLFAAATLLAVYATETMRFGTDPIGQVLIPKIAVPPRLRLCFLLGAVVYIGTWGVGSFFQGFSAQFAEAIYGRASAFLASCTYLVLIVPNAASGLLGGRFDPIRGIPILLTLFLAAGLALFACVHWVSVPLFVVAVVLCGTGIGASCSLSLKLLLSDSTLRERAGLISALYLSAYVGSGLPNFVIGQWASDATMDEISLGFAAWIALTWAAGFALLRAIRAARASAAAPDARPASSR